MGATKTTAIIYFSRTAEEEIRHKTFSAKSAKLNKVVASKLYDHSLSQIKKTGLPFVLFTEEVQSGNSFGERLANAFESTFEQGFESVIAVGSDCPLLTSQHLLDAASVLAVKEIVAGPTTIGGSYLLGIKHSSFDYDAVAKPLRWQTNNLFADLSETFPQLYVLESLAEVNEEMHFAQSLSFRNLINNCFSYIYSLINAWSTVSLIPYSSSQYEHAFVYAGLPARAP